jgi:hypothetical protein
VAAALAGDTKAAERVELVLPGTSVCKLDSRSREATCDVRRRPLRRKSEVQAV